MSIPYAQAFPGANGGDMARSADEYSQVFSLRQLEAALMAKQPPPPAATSTLSPQKAPALNSIHPNTRPTTALTSTQNTQPQTDGQELHVASNTTYASQRTPTQPDSPDEDDADVDEVEFVLEVTPIQSEIDTESVAGISTKSDIYSVSSQTHRGSGVACRYYNRGRCFKGTACPYSHAPDQYSLRSHPDGPNVCLYFIHNDKCRYTEQQCNYSHRRSDLNWNDEELKIHLADAITNKRKENAKIGKGRATPSRNRGGDKLRPNTAPVQPARAVRGPPRGINRYPVPVAHVPPPLPLRIPEVQRRWEHEMAIRLVHAGSVHGEIATLLAYGTPKPWDDGAWLRLDQICGYPAPQAPFPQYPDDQRYSHRGMYPF